MAVMVGITGFMTRLDEAFWLAAVVCKLFEARDSQRQLAFYLWFKIPESRRSCASYISCRFHCYCRKALLFNRTSSC